MKVIDVERAGCAATIDEATLRAAFLVSAQRDATVAAESRETLSELATANFIARMKHLFRALVGSELTAAYSLAQYVVRTAEQSSATVATHVPTDPKAWTLDDDLRAMRSFLAAELLNEFDTITPRATGPAPQVLEALRFDDEYRATVERLRAEGKDRAPMEALIAMGVEDEAANSRRDLARRVARMLNFLRG